MNECLNNDDEDEEAHRWSFSCFFTINCVSPADAGAQTIPFHQVPCFDPLFPEGDRYREIFSCIGMVRKHNGLIAG